MWPHHLIVKYAGFSQYLLEFIKPNNNGRVKYIPSCTIRPFIRVLHENKSLMILNVHKTSEEDKALNFPYIINCKKNSNLYPLFEREGDILDVNLEV